MNNNSEKAARSRKKALGNGAVLVHAVLAPPVAEALRGLEAACYAPGKTAILSRAILEAWQRQKDGSI